MLIPIKVDQEVNIFLADEEFKNRLIVSFQRIWILSWVVLAKWGKPLHRFDGEISMQNNIILESPASDM
jgi:hypothetical protein